MLPKVAAAEQTLMDDIAAKGRASERGAIQIGGGPPRRRKDVMREAAKSNLPAIKSDRMPPGGLPKLPQKGSMEILNGPLGVLGATGAIGGSLLGLSHLVRSGASTSDNYAPDLPRIRREFANDYAKALTLSNPSEGRVEFFAARLRQMDDLLQRESVERPQGPNDLEQARADILSSLVTQIEHRPGEDLSNFYRRLDQIDQLIVSGGVPAVRPEGAPPTPSLKPVLPQL